MEHAYLQLLHALAGHPGWTLAVVFLAAFLEAIAVIGTFIPGSTAMFLAGALVGTGSLNLGWLFGCAIAGAVAGDGLSYWLGSRYKARIAQIWPFRTHPQVLEVGNEFFAKHGAKSIVLARFIGPLRAIIPVVVGMLGMPPLRFYAVNVLSALLWAPVHILPGVVFGASVQLAGAVSFRLVVLLALFVGSIWLTFRVARFVLSRAEGWAKQVQLRLSLWARGRKGRLGRLSLQMLGPDQPAAGVIAGASTIVLLSGWLFLGVLEDVLSGDPLMVVDASVFHFMQSMRTPWGDAVLSDLATLGSVATLAALAGTAALWMVWERRWHTLGYWLSALAFSQLLAFGMQVATHRAAPGSLASDAYVFPSNHVAAAVVVYGFLAFLVARRVGLVTGFIVTTASAIIVAVVALAGLYFGRYWFSDAIAGAALASVWISIVALTIVWRHPTAPPSNGLMPFTILAVLCCSVALQIAVNQPSGRVEDMRRTTLVLGTEAQWTESLWKRLPCYRSDMDGDRKEPFSIQWSADIANLANQLRVQGWVEGTDLSTHSLLSLASPHASAISLPVLPRLNNGVPSSLVLVRPGATRDERDVLRFWPSGYVIKSESNGPDSPLWLGSLVHERLYRASWLINILHTDAETQADLNGQRKWLAGSGVRVPVTKNCHGFPVTLLASPTE
ncbi:bifunctional DedA family/phosphatase PAP2 family protein [Caballeronia mineralivorans]|uniref:bifunctional DedA family/phosphatase PAP2 family protein n=1 Tax=Caballeronia mineralivorans TaxID=2010198 RepID=UPI0023F18509|nr:bifunctional DedA family/phosphatase PAP2 family protein [Caballeronia mineralivorans]MDB5784601.1 superfamily protein [Caballeronia mineralivorans]